MQIDGWLLDILACPECHAPLRVDEEASELVCTSSTCGLASGPARGLMSDDLDGWGGAEFVLAADRLDTPDVIEAADPGDMLRQVASAAGPVRHGMPSCL